jgi:hypothetical protein
VTESSRFDRYTIVTDRGTVPSSIRVIVERVR